MSGSEERAASGAKAGGADNWGEGVRVGWAGALMPLPLVVLFATVAVWPLVRAVWWGVHDGRSLAEPARFTIFGHLARMAGDRALWLAFGNTAGFTVALAAVLLPVGLGLAMLLNGPRLRGRSVLRTVFFSTHLVGPVYVAAIVVSVAARLSRGGGDVLGEPFLAMPVVLAASVWMGAGWAMTYFLAALQAVDSELLDAARMDGAGRAALFRHVTWPAVKPTAMFVGLVTAAGGLQLFELPFVLFQGPGPANAALTLSMYLFSVAFEQGDLGYATAIGWVLALVVTGVGLAATRRATGPAAAGEA